MFGPLFTVLPGVVAYNYFNGSIKTPDNAYPALVSSVLPDWAFGLFGAVIFGAILSSFVGSLNSTTTLLTLDFYKPIFGKNKSDKHIACRSHCDNRYWRNCSRLAPVISLFPSGLYAVVQQFNGVYSMPVLVLVLVAFYSKKTSKLGAKVALATHIVIYAIVSLVFTEINYLYTFSVLFFVDLIIVLMFNKIKPSSEYDLKSRQAQVDMTPWKYRYVAGIIILALVVISYIIFSPLVLAK